MSIVELHYFTDPACPWSWALEPSIRGLLHEFDGALVVKYVMGGLAREFGDPRKVIADALDASERGGMPVDVRLWLADPPRSSYPACIAVKAAAEQGDPGPYLRRLREALMCRRRKLDTAEPLVEEARAVPGIDVERFRVDLSSHAVLEAFGADLERAAEVPAEHHAPGTGRAKLPSLEFRREDGTAHAVYGYAAYETLRAAALAAGAEPGPAAPPGIEDALRRFGTMAAAEVAAVCQLPGPRGPAELWRLAVEWRVRPERCGGGELWTVS